MGYQLFSDMTADVSEALMRGMPEVAYVPMQVELGGESFTYGPGSSLTVEQFYAEQRAGKFASTSQINPMIYRRCFEQALKAGEVLGLRFAVMHNLYFYNALMRDIRDALDQGIYAAFAAERKERLDRRI